MHLLIKMRHNITFHLSWDVWICIEVKHSIVCLELTYQEISLKHFNVGGRVDQETCPLRLSVPFAMGEARQSNNSIGPYYTARRV